jgi:hypothetical protein
MYKGTLFIIKYNYVCADCFDGEISCGDTTLAKLYLNCSTIE